MKEFNIIINGVGGQGLITLLKIISEATFFKNFDIKTSELHGLSQRGGSVEVHIRFGKKIFSPLIPLARANLALALETREVLFAFPYLSPDSIVLINQYLTPTFIRDFSEKEVIREIKKISKKVFLIPATEICEKELKEPLLAGIYLLGLASFKDFLPLKPDLIEKAIRKTIPGKYLEINLKAFNLAKGYLI